MAELREIGGVKLPKHIEDTFRDAREDAIKGATAVIIMVITEAEATPNKEATITYKTHHYGIKNSHTIGYLELAKQQVFDSMSR